MMPSVGAHGLLGIGIMDAKHERDMNSESEAGPRLPGGGVSIAEIAIEAAFGAAAGATTGALAGPPGVVAGAVIGGAVGAVAAIALNADHTRAEREAELDGDIGVIGGNIGAAPADALPSVRGAFHAASLGVSTSQPASSDGPIQNLDED
jgi:hypothetical protein